MGEDVRIVVMEVDDVIIVGNQRHAGQVVGVRILSARDDDGVRGSVTPDRAYQGLLHSRPPVHPNLWLVQNLEEYPLRVRLCVVRRNLVPQSNKLIDGIVAARQLS